MSPLLLGLLSTAIIVSCSTAGAAPAFKLYFEDSGIYRVTFEQLVEAGLASKPWASDLIRLRGEDAFLPVWVEDGGDGQFFEGDAVVFAGEMLHAQHSFLSEYSRFNCYFLDLQGEPFEPGEGHAVMPSVPTGANTGAPLEARLHLEQDLLMLRFQHLPGDQSERWYWAKLTHLDGQPFVQRLTLAGLKDDSTYPVRLRMGFKGWSEPANKTSPDIPDHQVDVRLNGRPIGQGQWTGNQNYILEVDTPVAVFTQQYPELQLSVPKRRLAKNGETLIDVVMLNWIELSYPHTGHLSSEQTRLFVNPRQRTTRLVATEAPSPLEIVTASGTRMQTGKRRLKLPRQHGSWVMSSSLKQLRTPDAIVLDTPSQLSATTNQADYLMICHHSLMEALAPLAELHRRRGLTVKVVDVQDVFDEFSAGLVDPEALRRFLSLAYHTWQRPRPRFVLLVGDASWDYKNLETNDESYADWTYRPGEQRRFGKNKSTPYTLHPDSNFRNLVPTASYETYQGHAASDTWLVCVDGDDDRPDMAIGRIPVVEPAEVSAVVAKTIEYIITPEVGPWRRRVLLLTNESRAFQRQSERTARELLQHGFAPLRIYPQAAETVNDENTRKIIAAMDEGLCAIHFLGHGGRYIWRTGPPDLKKNHDLFTLEHLDQLEPTRRLPMVLSLTCYSAPFDHPSADSIGEKLLRLPHSGAIAVLAASWRNQPSAAMGRAVLSELLQPGTTIGDAILKVKQELRTPLLIQTYNLLGDPAAPPCVPSRLHGITLTPSLAGFVVRGQLPENVVPGRALVELFTDDLEIAASTELVLEQPTLGVELAAPDTAVLGASVYVWSEARHTDGAAWVDLE